MALVNTYTPSMGSSLRSAASYEVGDIFGGIARIVEVRRGGMGVVYICKGLADESNFKYAVKTYAEFEDAFRGSVSEHVLTSVSDRLRDRFLREAVINLDLPLHPNIVTAHWVGHHNGAPFIQMEFVDGPSLREVIDGGQLTLETAIGHARQLAEGLRCAFNERGVLHRDVKPDNVLISPLGILKIADFGLAASIRTELLSEHVFISGPPSKDASASKLVGTLPYMSPENVVGASKPTVRSDIYSFGIVLYELFTGRVPYHAATVDQLVGILASNTTTWLDALRGRVPEKLVALVVRCLSRRPEDRYADYDTLIRELDEFPFAVRLPIHSSAQFKDNRFRKIMGLINLGMEAEALRHLSLQDSDTNVTSEVLHAAGTAFGNLGMHEKAIDTFNQCLAGKSPVRPQTLHNKGNSLLLLGRVEEAIRCYEEAVELDRAYVKGYAGLAAAKHHCGEFAAAIGYCDQALALDPDQPVIWSVKARCHLELENRDAARTALEQGVNRCGARSTLLIDFACVHELLGDAAEATRLMDAFLKSSPTLSETDVERTLSFFLRRKEGNRALDTLTRLVRAMPENAFWDSLDIPAVTELRVDALVAANELDRADALIKQALGPNPQNIELLVRKSQILRRRNEHDAAFAILKELLQHNPHSPAVLHEFGCIHTDRRQYDEALEFFDQAVVYGGGPQGSYFARAQVLIALNQMEEALRACEMTLAATPEDLSAQLLKGQILRSLDRLEEALRWLGNVLAEHPRNTNALEELWQCNFALKRYDEALLYADMLVECASTDGLAWYYKGETLFRVHKHGDALKCFLKSVTCRENLHTAYCGIGVYHLLHEDYAQADLYFAKALELSPNYRAAIMNRCVAQARRAIRLAVDEDPSVDESDLIAEMEQRLSMAGYAVSLSLRQVHEDGAEGTVSISPDPHKKLPQRREEALLLADRGAHTEAIRLLKQLVREVPSDRESWHALAASLDESGCHAEALPCFDEAMNRLPSSYVPIESLNGKGEALRKLNRLTEACSCFDEVLKYRADHELASNNKGLCLKDLGRIDDARQCYQAALVHHPISWRALGNLGQLEAQQGNEAAALDCCRRLKSLPDQSIDVYVCLCCIFSQLQQASELQAALAQLKKLDPGHPLLAIAAKRSQINELPRSSNVGVQIRPSKTAVNPVESNQSTQPAAAANAAPGAARQVETEVIDVTTALKSQCATQLAAYDRNAFSAEVANVEGRSITSPQLISFSRIQATFTLHLYYVLEGGVQHERHVTDFHQNGKATHFVTHGKGEVGMFAMFGHIVEIIEISGPDVVWNRNSFAALCKPDYAGKPFLYCHSNPIVMLERLIRDGCNLEWCAFGIGYQEGGLKPHHGVRLCMYWCDKKPVPIFHLASDAAVTSIRRWCEEVIADDVRCRRMTIEDANERVTAQDLSRLIDHPVFYYYLCGKTAAVALEECGRPKPVFDQTDN